MLDIDPNQTDSTVEASSCYRVQINDMMRWAGIAHWEYEVANGVFNISTDYLAIYGYESKDLLPLTVEKWKQIIHPDDCPGVLSMFDKIVAGHADVMDVVYRVRTALGEWRYFRRRGGVAEVSLADRKVIRISGTLQDVTDLKISDELLQRRDRLLAAVNDAANILLATTASQFDQSVVNVLNILGMATEVDRVYVWKNELMDNELGCTQVCESSPGVEPQQGNELTVSIKYREAIPTWEACLSAGDCVNNIVRLMPQAEQDQLSPQGIISILVAPVMFRNEFWGFIGFDDCQRERIWDKTEAGILKSAGMLIASAIQRQQTERALIQAKDVAEMATKAKSDFLARMSHEIRTPMNAILGMIYLCLQTDLSNKQWDYLTKTQSAAHSLLGVINDILDFSKIEAGKLELEAVPFSLQATVKEIIDVVRVNAEEKGLKLISNIDPCFCDQLVGDPLRLRQILLNLIGNAIKFTKIGEITITVRQNDAQFRENSEKICILFEVKDTGIGLKPEQVNTVFESFSQADGSTTRKYGGTGLGLSIVKSLVELMGGKVYATSVFGLGTTFYFSIIFVKSHAEPELSSAVLLNQRRVLLVDDDANDLEVLTNMMQAYRMDVRSARTGAKALEMLEEATAIEAPFELVLIDWRMPRMDGVETIRNIRQSEKTIVPPHILMTSAYDRQECLRHVQGLNVCDVLIKPVQPDRFKAILKTVFREDLTHKTDEERADIRGTKILLAEDNKINQLVATELLTILGVDVTIANNGIEAVEAVKKTTFDLILMDIQMPEMDGLTATRMIRKLDKPEVNKMPILAMTANATDLDYQKSLEIGMNDHLTKPIDPEKLRIALEKWVVR